MTWAYIARHSCSQHDGESGRGHAQLRKKRLDPRPDRHTGKAFRRERNVNAKALRARARLGRGGFWSSGLGP